MTEYVTFWMWLPLALQIAEVKHGFPGKAMSAIRRLKRIEGSGIGDGTTGYVNGNDPYTALNEFVAFHYGETAEAPFWLKQYPQAMAL